MSRGNMETRTSFGLTTVTSLYIQGKCVGNSIGQPQLGTKSSQQGTGNKIRKRYKDAMLGTVERGYERRYESIREKQDLGDSGLTKRMQDQGVQWIYTIKYKVDSLKGTRQDLWQNDINKLKVLIIKTLLIL